MEAQKTYEQRLEQVKEIIDGIEGGQQSLEESVKSFESGMKALQELEKELGDMKRRVTILMENGEEKPLEAEA